MKNSCVLLFLFFSLFSYGQVSPAYAAVDAKMAAIPANSTNSIDAIATYITLNFKTDTDKIRAAFYWTSSNISYNVANMYAVNFQESTQEKIARTLKTKRGVCIHYAEVLNALSEKIGIQSYIIQGYTKQNGKVGNLAHAWTAARIDKKWYVFDPTWGSGYVNNGQFSKKLNNLYFKAEPTTIIASHIPFDYVWQFLNYPVTNQEFYEGKIQMNKSKKYFDFEKEIIKYNALSEVDQLLAAADRIEKNGLKNTMIVERYEGKKRQFMHLRKNTNIEKLNSIVNEMNDAVVLLNDFIHYRNNKFNPVFSDTEISSMIEIPVDKLAKCQNEIYSIGSVGTENAASVASIKKSISKALAQAKEHALFVQNYLSKSKMVRKTMFSSVTWL
ncbi:transglutaminase domain-containing protein [Flavobacterium sp. LB2R40]|uniref:transglutaminase domain-containing protein n=1 Tax=unclassified Flavobacterium TaxID=196869 RepID=UPI003AAA4CF0